MKQSPLMPEIVALLAQFSQEVKDNGKLKLNDINIISEDVLVPILSIAYNTDLINLNQEKSNYPGIDLATNEHITYGSKTRRIAFQITSTNNIDKIIKTLKGYIKGEFYKKFDEIYIYNLIEKQKSYQKASVLEVAKIIDNKFNFDLTLNVIDKSNLEQKIKSLSPVSKIIEISKLLKDQFVYKKKSLLSLEIWESDGKFGYGFSNLLNSIDLTTYNTLITEGIPNEAKDLLQILLTKYNIDFSQNYENRKVEKFKNLGFNTYLKAGFTQAIDSYQVIKEKVVGKIDKDDFSGKLSDAFKQFNTNLDESSYPLVYQPESHPAILFVKETISALFPSFGIPEDIKDLFLKNFNQNIQSCIIESFGKEDYIKHTEKTQEKWIRENEKDLLIYTKELSKLGFVEGEELEYQDTFGTWQDVRDYGITDEKTIFNKYSTDEELDLGIDKIESLESKLAHVEKLIEEYFNSYKGNKEGYLNNILFLIADFGKGKTSFLHYFASKLAKQYLKTHEGLFPVYLNLNEYDKYSNSPSLGVIANFLAKRFKIDIKDEYFKKKNYFFLIDSLDECGELSETNIDKVIKDVIEIQNLDNINQRFNRVIVASRPIAKGLKEQISKYKPFPITVTDTNSKKKETFDNYISVYGFTKIQFDKYVAFALKKYLSVSKKNTLDFTGFSNTLFARLELGKNIALYSELYQKVLKLSELKRPIFAYMIYKLIISNSNFIDLGKVGVYISFLNQLSREAKHKDDQNIKVSLKDEFVYRNILHASALLWQFKRQSGEQTSLTKADICRTIEEKEINKDDRIVLNEFKDVESVHFLSHSYLGEKENTLHFQHQSFAEILLAEYYLKVIIKYALEDNNGFEGASVKLSIGLPTDQTMDFLKGLLIMLKESAQGSPSETSVIAKRQLLIPLLASLAIKEHNVKLHSSALYYTWFKQCEHEIFINNRLDEKLLNEFPISQTTLDKIVILCQKIIDSPNTYLLEDHNLHTVIFKDELISFKNSKGKFYDIDKWFALLTGNTIANDNYYKHFFNANINAEKLFDLIQSWNFNIGEIPIWGRDLFKGISTVNRTESLIYKNLDANFVNFSYGIFRNLILNDSDLRFCNFSNSIFDIFSLEGSDITFSFFDNIDIIRGELDAFNGYFNLTFCKIGQGVFFPSKLNEILKGTNAGLINQGSETCIIYHGAGIDFIENNLYALKGIFKYILKIKKSVKFIISAFDFQTKERSKKATPKMKFIQFIQDIEKELKDSEIQIKKD